MNRITIDGITIEVEGNNVHVQNGKVMVGGVEIKGGLTGKVDIKFEGSLASLRADGNVECGDVQGDVQSGGSIKCGEVGGDVTAGGSVTGTGFSGDIMAGGSVKITK